MHRADRLLYKKIIAALPCLIFLLLYGCTAAPETVTRDRYMTLDPIVLRDTLRAEATDTVVTGYNIVKSDTVALIKYLPVKKEFIYRIKTDTIKIKHMDTLKVTKTSEAKNDFTHWYNILGLLCALAGIIYLTVCRLKR